MEELRILMRSELVNDADISGVVGTRIYNALAPDGASYPYIIISLNSGGDENDTQIDSVDFSFVVKCVSEDVTQAETIRKYIRTALHDANLGTNGGWSVFWCRHEQVVDYFESEQRRRTYHRGGIYRVRASK